ncbi:MAG: hypothetical protein IH624_13950 [Phycisphaerae bacterium]|nr:hypothetical protein [Phycisphaerae bacterium]
MATNTKPIKSFRSGNIEASIWKDEQRQQGGNSRTRYSVRIHKQFKNKRDQYETTDYFWPDELPRLCLVAKKAYEFIALKESREEAVPV